MLSDLAAITAPPADVLLQAQLVHPLGVQTVEIRMGQEEALRAVLVEWSLAVAPAPFAVAAAYLEVQLPAECLGHVLEGLTSLPAGRHFPDITQGLELGVFRLELGAGGKLVGVVAGFGED